MSSFGFGEEDDEDGVLDTQFSFPEEGKCLTQVSEMEESQVCLRRPIFFLDFLLTSNAGDGGC